MHPVIELLVRLAEIDPLPCTHTSSHWQRYGQKTVMKRDGDDLMLQAAGFETYARRRVPDRILNWMERLSYLRCTSQILHYPYVWQIARRLAADLSGSLTFNVFKSTSALALLMDHWKEYGLSPKTFVLIGDGYGFLGALIRRCVPDTRLYCIDLPKILVFQAHTHWVASPGAAMTLQATDSQADRPATQRCGVTFVTPDSLERVSDTIDCAISISSMQEMNDSSIRSYFEFLRARSTPGSRFYCVNRQYKALPGGEIASFVDYPWRDNDEVFVDGVCPFYTHFLDLHTLQNGPRLLGLRIPCVNYFDGVHLHRLVRLVPPS